MSDCSDDETVVPPPIDMPEGLVELFKSFISRNDFLGALEFARESESTFPTPSVVNEIIFKILMNCDEDLAYDAQDYLKCSLDIMPDHDDKTYNLINALDNQSGSKSNVWNTFSHLVWSCLYHLDIPEAKQEQADYVKTPNCEILVELYFEAFLKCPLKSSISRASTKDPPLSILGDRVEERLSSLLKWINLLYKYDIEKDEVLSILHKLLDYIVDSEISGDPKSEISNNQSLPTCVKFHTANLSKHMFLILNCCKDVFTTVERMQKFFIYSSSEYLTIKVCQYKLNELIGETALHQNPGMLTLKSIVKNYFFCCPKEEEENQEKASPNARKYSKSPRNSPRNSPRRSNKRKSLKKFSKDTVQGDIVYHECCRLGKPADLLNSLYMNKTQDINAKNCVGNTPLHEACLSASYLCAKFLFDEAGGRKVDVTATDNEGRTPLHCAVYVNAFDIVKLLLNRGGNDLVKCEDSSGKRPIDYCQSAEMRNLLKSVSEEEIQKLKNPEDYPIYLRALRVLISSYCEIYDLPKCKPESQILLLSHDRKECYHYKAESDTLCEEDSSTLASFHKTIEMFISSIKCVQNQEIVKKELGHWASFASAFK